MACPDGDYGSGPLTWPSNGPATTSITNIFVSFDRPVKAGTLLLSSADYVMPKYEVKEFNNRFA